MVLALASAASFAVYLVASSRLARATGALTLGAWVAAGAAVSFVAATTTTGGLDSEGRWRALVVNGIATASAFALMFAALDRLGPTRTSVVMTLEAFFGIVLAAAVLGEGLRPVQALGGVGVLGAAAVVALSRGTPVSRRQR
ncbi:MAG: DMT family transporter [Actinomycetota bacterium]|nr:DMT family transporter [Actinomycetota bacterium]